MFHILVNRSFEMLEFQRWKFRRSWKISWKRRRSICIDNFCLWVLMAPSLWHSLLQSKNWLMLRKFQRWILEVNYRAWDNRFCSWNVFNSCFPLIFSIFFSFPGMNTGGLFWFKDLTVPDPYYLLPLVSAITVAAVFKVSQWDSLSAIYDLL